MGNGIGERRCSASRWNSGVGRSGIHQARRGQDILRLAFAGLLLLAWQSPVFSESPEYQTKAAMLANIVLFVEWPSSAFPSPESPFLVCILGSDPFGPELKHELGERVETHPIEVRHLADAEAARKCHMVFISRSEQSRLEEVMSKLRGSGALCVGDFRDAGDFCRNGGMIDFVMEGEKVRIELNMEAAERAGFRIDPRLKRVVRSSQCGEE